ncbi:MAG: WbqC family protein [Candidatus Omnitrophica bacterium]|nr:WbqC family protein [Candidatus Omnitrophota bacterium]MDD5236282.1 WbqC family protein [Candidatus Omnitrophota bacterium]MDD5610528.1 WbqC family protein [Candidatus Omnitrophota bacterium]
MILSVHQPQYIPWLGYFHKIAHSDAFVFLDNVQFKAREFQNRNKIRTKDGWAWLTVPVISKGKGRQKINDVLIDNDFPWRRQHAKALEASYGGSEPFHEYFPFFEEVFSREWEKLSDLNMKIIDYILKQLAISTPVFLESKLAVSSKSTERIIEICKKMKADNYLSGIGGREYLKEEKFKEAGITLIYQDFTHPVYHQHFINKESDFIPYMSVLDLLFNEGPRSRDILLGKKA